MPHPRPSSFVARLLTLVIVYTLLITSVAPFSVARTNVVLPGVSAPMVALPATPAAAAAARTRAAQSAAEQRNGELLVRFREGVDEGKRNEIVAGRGARRARKLKGANRLERIELAPGDTPEAAQAALVANAEVEVVEPNFVVRSDQTTLTNDARSSEQWALDNTGAGGGLVGSDIRAAAAWRTTTGATSTVIAVVDSGVDFSHPDLANNRWTNAGEKKADGKDEDRNTYTDDLHGWDFVADTGTISDPHGHGTAVAGIIAAQGDNHTGISGVMWRAGLMSLRVLDSTGRGDTAAVVEAIDYAVAHGASVINLSLGTEGESVFLREAIERAGRSSVVVVTTAGNGGRDLDVQPYYPASYKLSNVVAVAATDGSDSLASWSGWGVRTVAVAAPGVEVLTTRAGGGYYKVSGTSAAAPHVSGIAGLVKTLRPWLTANGTAAAIRDGARRVEALSGKAASAGVASAAGAISALQGPHTPPPSGGSDGNGGGGNGNGGGSGADGNGGGSGNGNGYGSDKPGTDEKTRGRADQHRRKPPKPEDEGHTEVGKNFPDLVQARRATSGPSSAASNSRFSANNVMLDLPPCDGGCGGGDPGYGGGGGGLPADPNMGTQRTEPQNETGQSGVDLGSRNYNWSLPLVGLPGRAGLDLGLTLNYNSLVWTRQGNTMRFNADHGYPGPGFRLGFPEVQPKYYDYNENVWSYVMITPSGGRVQMRQVNGSNVYESQDSSYTQLIEYADNTVLVRPPDGSGMRFSYAGDELHCDWIKDRNGNYLYAYYNSLGRPTTIIDTLGRHINFNYSANGYLASITQQRGGATHTWATFSYAMLGVAYNFSGLYVEGPQNGAQIPVLTSVGTQTGDRYDFSYTSYAQVNRITHYAPDGGQLAYTSYNLETGAVADCPRFTERRDWVLWGVMNASQEVVTSYAVDSNGAWSQVTTPDGVTHKEFFATSGWGKGLTVRSETWAGGVLRKWTTTEWTQDDGNLPYAKNPRPYDTSVYDEAGNRRRTDIQYTTQHGITLPGEVREYSSDGSGYHGFLRRTYTNYRWDVHYMDRRIIGLPAAVNVYDENNSLVSKVDYHYDWASAGFFTQQAPSVGHDGGNYPGTFVYGRGNLIATRRFNVHAPEDETQAAWSGLSGYNAAGSVVFVRATTADHLAGAQTNISYADSYADGNNSRNTLAYPTAVTDPDGYSSTTQYNYDLGAPTRVQTPQPNTIADTPGPVTTTDYDAAGRIARVTNQANGAYTRYVYPAAGHYVQSFSTVQDGREVYSATFYDGVGRERAKQTEFPGSVGGYNSVHHLNDAMGRRTWTSNPTEINASWVAAGDDAVGRRWMQQVLDWQGRPTVTTNTDGTTTALTYTGCGCAGGEQVTARDESGRLKRMTKDVLGRHVKTEELHRNGSVYSTATYGYNGRDQLTSINHEGQVRAMEYDGHGRLWRRTTPEQGATTYSYNLDDTVQSVTDARGATQTFSYNARHLVTNIGFGGWAGTPDIGYAYDAAGNRTSMTDGLGSQSYTYDALSRLKDETRTFSGLPGSYKLSYEYNLAGGLTKITNPWGAQVGYDRDHTGQTWNVTGAGYAGVSTYASGIGYRASGAVKAQTYGNGRQFSATYDERLRLKTWNVAGVNGYEYGYDNFGESTGRVTYARNLYDQTLDRSFYYDEFARLHFSHTGSEARAHLQLPGSSWVQDGPYSQGYGYDVWGNLTQRWGWGGERPSYTLGFDANNRRHGSQYDAAGNMTHDGGQSFVYDATGQQVSAPGAGLQMWYDGDRLRGKKTEGGQTIYYLRSSVLGGQPIAEVDGASGGWWRGYVYDAGGALLALQQGGVEWTHSDPIVKGSRLTNQAGGVTTATELDPWGAEVSARSFNSVRQPQKYTSYIRDQNASDEAMHRRYNRWWSRFDQPDPYDGSYDLADPQSFNRYAYVLNDPVNNTDPSGLCTFNFSYTNSAGVSNEAIRSMRGEINRIFRAAGHNVVFNQPRFPGVNSNRSYSLNIQSGGRTPGSTPGGRDVGYVTNRGSASTERLAESIANGGSTAAALGRNGTNFGRALGRVGAHESMHYFLQLFQDQHTSSGLMQTGFTGSEWFSTGNNADFLLSQDQVDALTSRCPPLTTTPGEGLGTEITPLPITPLPGGGGGGGFGGGGGGGFGGGVPSYIRSSWAFADWISSIPVGRDISFSTSVEVVSLSH